MYRAVDQYGQVIDVFVSPRRDAGAAQKFFVKAIKANGREPAEVVTDKAGTSRRCSTRYCPGRFTTQSSMPTTRSRTTMGD
ncbi:MAG: transposase [Actinomycetota bacterium]|nr:transposase [Actinomycetota bacterium]MDQ6949664.1 transposase [Actinomycetota bacterium]